MLGTNAATADPVRPALPSHLTPAQRDALSALATVDLDPALHREAHKTLRPILAPIEEAGSAPRLVTRTRSTIRKVILQGMRESGAYGKWSIPTWAAVARTAGEHAMSTMAIGCWLGAFTSDQALDVGVQPVHFARRLFGREAVEYQIERVQQYLKSVGYGPTSADRPGFVTALATLMVRIGHVELEAMTIDVIEAAHHAEPARPQRRRAYFRLARALHRMGLIPRRIPTHVYIRDAATDVDLEWSAWCDRWRATCTFAPRTAQGIYYSVLRAGRWPLASTPQ